MAVGAAVGVASGAALRAGRWPRLRAGAALAAVVALALAGAAVALAALACMAAVAASAALAGAALAPVTWAAAMARVRCPAYRASRTVLRGLGCATARLLAAVRLASARPYSSAALPSGA